MNTDQLKPYFQVVSFNGENEFNNESFRNRLNEEFGEDAQVYSISEFYSEDELYIYHIIHKYYPTWVKRQHRGEPVMNKEHDLLIIYRVNSFLFIHCTCDSLRNIVISCISESHRKLNSENFLNILTDSNMQIRALGIQNVFNSGGLALESKAYFGKDTKFNLSSAIDSGYAFSYCLGTITGNESKQIGCSINKSKVWRTWTEGLEDFKNQCMELSEAFQQACAIRELSVLVTPICPTEIQEIIGFYLDHYIHKKGIVLLGNDNVAISSNWDCYWSEDDAAICVKFNEDNANIVKINIIRELVSGKWVFSYEGEYRVSIAYINENEDSEISRKRDFISFLNDNSNFTIVFSDGIAFRDGGYWRDNRIANPFLKSENRLISWANTTITLESKSPGRTDTIADTLENYFLGQNVRIGINDDGANEVADLIVLTQDDKLILVHSKFSSESQPGLRVGDLQVVISQAIKNLRYFIPILLFEKIERWEDKQFANHISFDEMQELFHTALNNHELKKECWIVQPGISRRRLEADSNNKIHCLLNYIDAVCKINNITFRFICSD